MHPLSLSCHFTGHVCCCSVAKSRVSLYNPMDTSTPGFPVLHCLPELTLIHVHWVSDASSPSHPLSPSSPFAFWVLVLEKNLEGLLDYKEIKPVNPKRNQPWVFIGRADAEAEAPKLWPPDAKNWLIGRDPGAGKDWGAYIVSPLSPWALGLTMWIILNNGMWVEMTVVSSEQRLSEVTRVSTVSLQLWPSVMGKEYPK